MISAKLRRLCTTDMDDLERHPPSDTECFCLFVRAMVGPSDSEGEESFDIRVCTPKWVERELRTNGLVFHRALLLVNHYNPAELRRFLTKMIENVSGSSWEEVAGKLSRVGLWEFEAY